LLARILAHAPALSDQLARRPELLDSLLDSSCFEPPLAAAEFAKFLQGEMEGRPYDVALDSARRLINERRFAFGVQLIDLSRSSAKGRRGLCAGCRGRIGRACRFRRSPSSNPRTAAFRGQSW
jgi:[glutamine synthetase] adenylyltransferase / [glutamine synthetase]-adenylyl-L-tyrosine phosphorylase